MDLTWLWWTELSLRHCVDVVSPRTNHSVMERIARSTFAPQLQKSKSWNEQIVEREPTFETPVVSFSLFAAIVLKLIRRRHD